MKQPVKQRTSSLLFGNAPTTHRIFLSRVFSSPLQKTSGRNRIETRLFVFIDTVWRKRSTTIQPASGSLSLSFANKT